MLHVINLCIKLGTKDLLNCSQRIEFKNAICPDTHGYCTKWLVVSCPYWFLGAVTIFSTCTLAYLWVLFALILMVSFKHATDTFEGVMYCVTGHNLYA